MRSIPHYDLGGGKLMKQTLKMIILGIGLLALTPKSCLGGIGQDLMSFFKRSGVASNVTMPGAYKDQTAGFYSGGSLVSRNIVRNAQLGTVQMPGFRAGCGGIDLWGGGFSHISSEQLVEMARNIGSATASYAFMLAVQTVSSQVYNIMNELQNVANIVNQTNINSCEAGATLLGGIWPKTDQSTKHLCQAMGTNLGMFSDYAAGRHECGAGGDRSRVIKSRGSDPRYKDMFAGEFNLAWKAIQANAFLSSNRELAQLFLTLVGSIIVRPSGSQSSFFRGGSRPDVSFQVINLAGHADRDDVITGLLTGGPTPIYICNDTDCLYPNLSQITLSGHSALRTRVSVILESLVQKIYDDGEPTEEEKDFLNSTRLPVFKMLNVLTAFRKGHAPLDIHQYVDLIALDVLYKYILEVIDIVHDSVTQLRSVQVDETHMERFLNNLRIARERITERRTTAFQHMDNVLSFIQSTQLVEKQLHVMMGSVASESNFY
jgi:conjugative transfer pilus assembly protein TraH